MRVFACIGTEVTFPRERDVPGDAVARGSRVEYALGRVDGHAVRQQRHHLAGAAIQHPHFDRVVVQQIVDAAAEVLLEEFGPARRVHFREEIGIEPGQFAAGRVECIQLLLLNDFGANVANQSDEPSGHAVGAADGPDIDFEKRLIGVGGAVEAKRSGATLAGGFEWIGRLRGSEVVRLSFDPFDRCDRTAAEYREERFAHGVFCGAGAFREGRVRPGDRAGGIENRKAFVDVADDEFVAAKAIEQLGHDFGTCEYGVEVALAEQPRNFSRIGGYGNEIGGRYSFVHLARRRADQKQTGATGVHVASAKIVFLGCTAL